MRIAPEIQSWGGGGGGGCPPLRESPYRVSCIFEVLAKQKQNSSAQGSLKFRKVSNRFWEGTRREKNSLKKVSYLLSQLVSQNKILLLHVVVLRFIQVFRSSNYA